MTNPVKNEAEKLRDDALEIASDHFKAGRLLLKAASKEFLGALGSYLYALSMPHMVQTTTITSGPTPPPEELN